MTQGAPGRPPEVHHRYGLDRHAESRTDQELQEQTDRELQSRYGPLGPLIGALRNPDRVDDLLDRQAARLLAEGAPRRSAPAEPATHYPGISHQQLYDSVHSGVDPGQVGDIGALWTELGNKLVAFNQRLATAIAASEADWVGRAGDAARQALADMGNRAGETGVSAQLAGTLFAQQARALTDVKNTVPPPPAEPFDVQAANDRLMRITDPVEFARQATADRAAFERQQADHREAARAVETYDRTVAQTAAAQPAFAPPPVAPRQPGESEPPPPGTQEQPGRPRTPAPTVEGVTETSATAPPATPGAEPVTAPPGSSTQTGGAGPGQTGAPGTGGGAGGALPGPVPGAGPGGAPGAGRGGAGRTPGGGKPGGRTGGLPGGAGLLGGTGGTGRGGAGAGRGAGGGGLPGPGGAAAAKGLGGGLPPGGASGIAPGAAGRPGTGPGPAAGAGRGAVGPAGAVGPGGVPAGARGEDDVEHQTPSYLVEPDPDEVFGAPGATAPPVIGDWDR